MLVELSHSTRRGELRLSRKVVTREISSSMVENNRKYKGLWYTVVMDDG